MKIGDTVYIVCSDTRYQSDTGTKKVIKVGNVYFEVEGCPWEKFLIKGQEADYSNKGKRTRDQYGSNLYWYPSQEAYEEIVRMRAIRKIVQENLLKLSDEEIKDIYNYMIKPKLPENGTI